MIFDNILRINRGLYKNGMPLGHLINQNGWPLYEGTIDWNRVLLEGENYTRSIYLMIGGSVTVGGNVTSIGGLPVGLGYEYHPPTENNPSPAITLTGSPIDVGIYPVTIHNRTESIFPGGTPNLWDSYVKIIVESTPISPSIIGIVAHTVERRVGEPFMASIRYNGHVTSLTTSELPEWAELTIQGGYFVISGTPDTFGSTVVAVTVVGPGGSDTKNVTISVDAGIPQITSGQTFSGKVGDVFTRTPALIGGVNRPVTSWLITGLPSWATYNAAGAITGRPNAVGSTVAEVTVTGPGGSDTKNVTITVAANPPVITIGQTFFAQRAVAFYGGPPVTTGGDATSWSATGLPPGLDIHPASGLISGTPTTPGIFQASVLASNVGGSDVKTLEITVENIAGVQTTARSRKKPFRSMITIMNERGEEVEFPHAGITIKELVENYGNSRVGSLTAFISADKQATSEETSDELNGLIDFPSVQAYPLIVRSGSKKTVKTLSAILASGSASVRLLVGGISTSVFSVNTTLQILDVNLLLSEDQALSLNVTSQSGAEGLGFTIGFVE